MQEIDETFNFPKFLSVLFIIQFVFFIIYSMNNKEDSSLLWFSVVILLIGLFLILAKFNLKISKNGINYSIFPFVNKGIKWKDVKNYEINKISALNDFAGWGIRYSKKYGWGYIFNSNYALTILTEDRKKVTFSIQHQDIEEIKNILTQNITK